MQASRSRTRSSKLANRPIEINSSACARDQFRTGSEAIDRPSITRAVELCVRAVRTVREPRAKGILGQCNTVTRVRACVPAHAHDNSNTTSVS